jgi:3-phenylpropionate/trans-cinnamate dioxygenase ferredoxin reductase component
MRIVLVGAGLAAQRCAETLRANGHDGPITMIGAEPHAPYDRPPLSKAILAGERPDLTYRPADVTLRSGERVVRVDPDAVVTERGERVPYDQVLIATGAEPVRLPGLEHAHSLRTLDDALRLDHAMQRARSIAIVGAGLIGQEVASAARARGLQATLIDAARDPFEALMGPGGGHHLRTLHEQAGVTLHLGRRLLAATRNRLRLDDDTIVTADLTLVAVGVRPAKLPTAEHVHFAGDVTGSAHWEAAARQGVVAARAMLGLPKRQEQPPVVWTDQYGVRIQRVGETRDTTPNGDLTYHRDGRLAAVVLINDPGGVNKARRQIKEAA